jgi:hypothetical protein
MAKILNFSCLVFLVHHSQKKYQIFFLVIIQTSLLCVKLSLVKLELMVVVDNLYSFEAMGGWNFYLSQYSYYYSLIYLYQTKIDFSIINYSYFYQFIKPSFLQDFLSNLQTSF